MILSPPVYAQAEFDTPIYNCAMDDEAIIAYMISRLGKGVDPDDLILEICQKTKRDWPDVAALLKLAQSEHGNDIASRQFPLLFILALGTFLGGMALIGYAAFTTVELFKAASALLDQTRADYETNLGLTLLLRSGTSPFLALVTGIGMLLGSLIGMRDTWFSILDKH